MKEAFAAALGAPVERAVLLAGGASKEAWAVDSDGRELLIRRAAGISTLLIQTRQQEALGVMAELLL